MKTRIFRNLWRANAVLIFTVGVVSLIVLAIAAASMIRHTFRQRDVRAVVNTDQQQHIDESLSLGQASNISGQPWFLMPLESDQHYDNGSYSKSATAVRNYAFMSATEPTHWLIPHNRFLILDADQSPGRYGEAARPTIFISFLVVEKDTDGNQRLTAADSGALVFTRPDGTGQVKVLEGVRDVLVRELVGEEILVIYRNAAGYSRAVFALKDFSLLREEKVEFPVATGTAPPR